MTGYSFSQALDGLNQGLEKFGNTLIAAAQLNSHGALATGGQ